MGKNKKKFDSRLEIEYDNETDEIVLKLSSCWRPSRYQGIVGVGQ